MTRTPPAGGPVLVAVLRALAWSARQGSVLLAVGIFGGVVWPGLATAFKGLVTPTVLLMMTMVLLRVDVAAAVGHLRRPGRVLAIVVVQMLLCPLIAWVVVRPLSLDPSIAAGIVIFATGCAAASSSAFARMVGLDTELSLLGMLAMLGLAPFTAPLVALQLLGVDLTIGAGAFMASLAIVVGAPLLISLVLRQAIGPQRLAAWSEAADGLLVWTVVFYGFAIMDGMTARAAADPAWIIQAAIAAFAVNYGLNLVTTLAFARWGLRPAATAGLMSGNRNMALFLAVLPATTDPGITLFFGVCQFPMYLSPFLLRPVYRRLLAWAARREDARSHT